IEREIPAVIAMQFEITDRAAIIFAGEFYAVLAEGQPVDAAVTQARLLVFADDNDVEWGTPVLFLRVQDGVLFDVADASALPRVTVEELPPKVAGTGTAGGGATVVGGGATEDRGADEGGAGTGDGAAGGPSGDGTEGASAVPLVGVIVATDGGTDPGAGTGSDGPRSTGDAGPTPTGGDAPPAAPPTTGEASAPPSSGLDTGGPISGGDGSISSGSEDAVASGGGGSGSGGSGEGGSGSSGSGSSSGDSGSGGSGSDGGGGSGSDGGGGSGSDGSGGSGSGSGSGGSGKVGPVTIHSGPALRALGVGAIALVVIVAFALLLRPWDDGGTGQASTRPSELASSSPGVTALPTPTNRVTPQPSTPASPTPPPTPPPPIKIAVEVVDRDTSNSRGIIDGVRLAVKDANGEVNGVPVTVPASVVFDDKGSADTGKDIIAKIVDDEDAVAVVGPYNSAVAIAEIPLSNAAGLLQCSPSATSESLTRPEAGAEKLRPSRPDAVNFVRTVTTNELDPIGAAMYLLDGLHKERVYVVDNGVSSAVVRAQRFQRYWQSRGASVVGTQSIRPSDSDFTALMADMRSVGTDAVYFSGSSGSSPTAVRLLKAIREAGLDATFMGSGEIFDGPASRKGSFLNLAADDARSNVYMTYPAAGDYEGRAAFEDRYEKTYGRVASLYAITAYACTEAILDALSRTDLSMDRSALREAVRENALNSTITYDSAMGQFRFDENGDTTLQIITVYDFPSGAADWRPVTYLDVPDQ
ncbi:MAG TPA: ABC transporter substrate-binding protein, partial [Candidatus Limnocylindrales bacterium]